jgi:hypothetical protein
MSSKTFKSRIDSMWEIEMKHDASSPLSFTKTKESLHLEKVRLPGQGRLVQIADKTLFPVVIREIERNFKRDHVLYLSSKPEQAGILAKLKFDGKDLILFCKATGLSRYFLPWSEDRVRTRRSFPWFQVKNLQAIELTGPSFGATLFGSICLDATFQGIGSDGRNEEHKIEISTRQNSTFRHSIGAFPLAPRTAERLSNRPTEWRAG